MKNEYKHMMITRLGENVNVTVSTLETSLNGWRTYWNVSDASKERLNELLKGKTYPVSAHIGDTGILLSISRS